MKKSKLIVFGVFVLLLIASLSISVFADGPVTWNPNDKGTYVLLSNNNLTAEVTNTHMDSVRATIGRSSGKWYWELKYNKSPLNTYPNASIFGVVSSQARLTGDTTSHVGKANGLGLGSGYYYGGTGGYGTGQPVSATFTENDVLAIKMDVDNRKVTWLINNVEVLTKDYPYSGDMYAAVSGYNHEGFTVNFGATPFTYEVPEGYLAYDGSTQIQVPSDLTATQGGTTVNLSWSSVAGATGYNVKRATTSGGAYTTIASNITDTTYSDADVANGTTYYYVVSTLTSKGESSNSDEEAITFVSNISIDISANDRVNAGSEFFAYVNIKNAESIYAEDITIDYDTTLFEFISAEPATEKLQILYQDASVPGKIRFIIASKGADYGLNGTEQMIKLTLKAKMVSGQGQVAAFNGLVADDQGEEIIAACSGKTIVVELLDADVNGDGRFSLGDLAITAFNLNKAQANWTNQKVDVDKSLTVDNVDLTIIVDKILESESSI